MDAQLDLREGSAAAKKATRHHSPAWNGSVGAGACAGEAGTPSLTPASNGGLQAWPNCSARLSHALDMAEGQPAGHALRACWIGQQIGRAIGLGTQQMRELYYATRPAEGRGRQRQRRAHPRAVPHGRPGASSATCQVDGAWACRARGACFVLRHTEAAPRLGLGVAPASLPSSTRCRTAARSTASWPMIRRAAVARRDRWRASCISATTWPTASRPWTSTGTAAASPQGLAGKEIPAVRAHRVAGANGGGISTPAAGPAGGTRRRSPRAAAAVGSTRRSWPTRARRAGARRRRSGAPAARPTTWSSACFEMAPAQQPRAARRRRLPWTTSRWPLRPGRRRARARSPPATARASR